VPVRAAALASELKEKDRRLDQMSQKLPMPKSKISFPLPATFRACDFLPQHLTTQNPMPFALWETVYGNRMMPQPPYSFQLLKGKHRFWPSPARPPLRVGSTRDSLYAV
jgi:hypothetical protein